jgi:lipopolysaccharide export LptBFGC system permease protein LptF
LKNILKNEEDINDEDIQVILEENLLTILSEFREEQIALAIKSKRFQNRTEEQVTYAVDKAIDSALEGERIGDYMRGKLKGRTGWTRG